MKNSHMVKAMWLFCSTLYSENSRLIWATISYPIRFWASLVEPPTWGVTLTLGWV